MTAYEEILTWSIKRPLWQRDALRRLLHAPLSLADLDELYAICTTGCLRSAVKVEPIPLAAHHLPSTSGPSQAVRIDKISDCLNVNAMRDGSSLDFAPYGLTVVYGDNGSGKSGYGRLLKRVCRTRGKDEPVLPNVYSDSNTVPSATITYLVDEETRCIPSTAGVQTNPELLRVSVFDAKAADMHVEKPNAVAYVPEGLELFEELASAARKIAAKVEAACSRLEDGRVSQSFARQVAGTAVETAVKNVGAAGADILLRELARSEPELVTRLSDAKRRLGELQASDPASLAAKYRRQAATLDAIAKRIDAASVFLSPDELVRIVAMKREAEEARKAADAAAAALWDEPLSETGGGVWKRLWQAAREFSALAYPHSAFPNLEVNGLCPLCQQGLDGTAIARMSRFEHFVRDLTQQNAEQLRLEVSAALARVSALMVNRDTDEGQLEEVEGVSPEVAELLRKTLAQYWPRKAYFEAILSHGCDLSLIDTSIYYVPKFDSEAVSSLALARRTEAENFNTEQVAAEVKRLRGEIADLEARRMLGVDIGSLLAEHGNRLTAKKLREALKDCATQGITQKQGELSVEIVTNALKDRFLCELEELGAKSLSVDLDRHRGEAGVSYHQIVIKDAVRKESAASVLSEGERRIVALAGFLADLATTNDTSALIFDDPVCSLDHAYRRAVAIRLAKLAKDRQVIVFTHDLSFICYLYEAVGRLGVEPGYREVLRAGEHTGYVVSDLPSLGVPADRRIGSIRQEIQNKKKRETQDPRQWRLDSNAIANTLRKAWERAVEEVLLDGVVQRFVTDVQTKRLKNVRVSVSDAETVYDAMTRLSEWSHDNPAEMHGSYATAAELEAEAVLLKNWIAAVKERRAKPNL